LTDVAAISPARKAAFNVLLSVERGNLHSDALLHSESNKKLSPADRNLATTLVLGVLRWQILLDAELKRLLAKTKTKLDPEVSIALRMGAFQLRFLDRVPAHAAIDESVELTKQSGHRFASGLVNAVLRKLTAAPQAPFSATHFASAGFSSGEPASASTTPAAADSKGQRLASRENFHLQESFVSGHGFSRAEQQEKINGALAPEEAVADVAQSLAHPAWLVERWTRFYGLDAARAICRHGQTQPARIVRLADPAVEAELIQAGIALEPANLLTAARTAPSGDVAATAAYREGRVRIQDEGSQLIAELAACPTGLDQKVKSIGDVCAAPGGKTLILAERNPEAHILACESSPHRLAELSERLAAYADRVECRLADATTLNEDSAFDLVLADVPCSGTGTLGRNPEIRHRLRADDLPRHAERQRAILSAALHATRPGGRVVYSTCSLEPEENEEVVAAVLAGNQAARQISLEPSIDALVKAQILTSTSADRLRSCLTTEGALRLLPGSLPTDGFFIALIEKRIQAVSKEQKN
jgi:16S rRNA (cytosine967-C5)-methyltransferase